MSSDRGQDAQPAWISFGLALGAGYVPAEFASFGLPMGDRGRRLTETVEILRLAGARRR